MTDHTKDRWEWWTSYSMADHTKDRWEWWTSNSWTRLRTSGVDSEGVLEPIVETDGHPDLLVSKSDMRLIEKAPDLLRALQMIHYHSQDRYISRLASDAIESTKDLSEGGE